MTDKVLAKNFNVFLQTVNNAVKCYKDEGHRPGLGLQAADCRIVYRLV